jgi:sialate O-acetylesterase
MRPAVPRSLVAVACASLVGWAASARAQEPPSLLHSLFSDHAVLQRDRPIPVWGRATPGETVTVSLGEGSASGTADESGRWSATLPALPAGGPHTLTARSEGGASESASDVLIGDVWLCSGQSNMAMSVARSIGGGLESRRPVQEALRFLTVGNTASPVPLEQFQTVSWSVAGPDTVGPFSATCYYFATELRRHQDVPMGLINASWGGSAIEAWISEPGLRAVGGLDERLDLLKLHTRDTAAANAKMGAMWESWWRSHVPDAQPWSDAADAGWRDAPEPLRDWKQWGVPELANHNGMVWFRRSVELTAEQAAQAATLSLGGIDEVDQTWLNGRPVGNTFGWGTERQYELQAGRLQAGENVFVVNVLNTWAAGGMLGPAEAMKLTLADGSSVPLGGHWSYQVAPTEFGYPPRAPWESIAGLTTLHGGMIAPLGRYALRGGLWYQGETNADAPAGYEALLTGLMADWRRTFGEGLPVLVVQLPGFGPAPTEPTASNWSEIREAERRAVAKDERAALAVTIDLGDRDDIHPANKRDVGRRLARAARHVVYGEELTPSGPVPLDARRVDQGVLVRFGDVEGELVTYSSALAIGFELCGSDQASCRFVAGAPEGDSILLDSSGAVTPERVRFCWGASPMCNLYDRSGLPVGPFELELR